MKKFRQGETVYVIKDNFYDHFNTGCPIVNWVEQFSVTNDLAPPPECVAFHAGKVSRHSLEFIPNEIKWRITRSRRKAETRCRIANQVNGVFQ